LTDCRIFCFQLRLKIIVHNQKRGKKRTSRNNQNIKANICTYLKIINNHTSNTIACQCRQTHQQVCSAEQLYLIARLSDQLANQNSIHAQPSNSQNKSRYSQSITQHTKLLRPQIASHIDTNQNTGYNAQYLLSKHP